MPESRVAGDSKDTSEVELSPIGRTRITLYWAPS